MLLAHLVQNLIIVTTDQERREQVLANEEEYTATLVKYFGIVL